MKQILLPIIGYFLLISNLGFADYSCTAEMIFPRGYVTESFTDYNCDIAIQRCWQKLHWKQSHGSNIYSQCVIKDGYSTIQSPQQPETSSINPNPTLREYFCSTESRGLYFSYSSYDIELARTIAILKCRNHRLTNWNFCEYNLRCG